MSEPATLDDLRFRGHVEPLSINNCEERAPMWCRVDTLAGKEYWNRWRADALFRQRRGPEMPLPEERGR